MNETDKTDDRDGPSLLDGLEFFRTRTDQRPLNIEKEG